MLWFLLAIGVWVAGVLILRAVFREALKAGRPLTRDETERLRTAAHEALKQVEARRSHLVIVKPSVDLDSQLVSRN